MTRVFTKRSPTTVARETSESGSGAQDMLVGESIDNCVVMGHHMHWQGSYLELGLFRVNPALCPEIVYQNYGRNIHGVDCRNGVGVKTIVVVWVIRVIVVCERYRSCTEVSVCSRSYIWSGVVK